MKNENLCSSIPLTPTLILSLFSNRYEKHKSKNFIFLQIKIELFTCLRAFPSFLPLFSTYNTYFYIAYKNCRAINILFYTFQFDFKLRSSNNNRNSLFRWGSKWQNMKIKSMNQILIRLLQMMHLKRAFFSGKGKEMESHYPRKVNFTHEFHT